jgi:diguanylate cyclase (GGDEF)-like protein
VSAAASKHLYEIFASRSLIRPRVTRKDVVRREPDIGETITPVEALVELARSAREDPLDKVLNTVAQTVHRVAGYRSGVLNLYRPAWDDYQMAVLVDRDDGIEEMQGRTNSRADFDRLWTMADERLPGVFFVSDPAFWEGMDNVIYPTDWAPSDDPDAWGEYDGLFVLLHGADGNLLGNLSIDEPVSGRRPSDTALRVLRAISSHAAYALDNARRTERAADMARIVSTLLSASSTLADRNSTPELLQSACDTIVPHMGFERVAAYRAGESSQLLLAATSGWTSRHGLPRSMSMGDIETLLATETEHVGCWLLHAETLFSATTGVPVAPRSGRNGHGAAAWNEHCLAVPIRAADGSLGGLVVVEDPVDHLLPIDAKRRALRLLVDQVAALNVGIETRARLQHLASHDPLTGVRNRRNLTELLEVDDEVALLICDLDDFKRINDLHGHDVGDRVLVRFGQLLRELARQGDVAMRLGGEEFCLVLPHTDRPGALAAAERLRAQTARAMVDLVPGGATVSIGVACTSNGVLDARGLMAAADRGLYAAKAAGRDRVFCLAE